MAPTPGDISTTVSLETSPGVFVSVTSDVMAGDTRRGKQQELDRYDAGVMSVTLENTDRAYDPQHAGGPYYGHLKPNKRIAATSTYAGITYPIFTGFVDRIRQVSTGPNTGTAVFEATDAFKPLSRAPLPSSAYAREVIADAPIRWWRLGDPTGSTKLVDEKNNLPLTITGAPTLAADSLIARDSDTAMSITASGQGGYAQGPGRAYTAFTLEMVFRSAATDDGSFYAETNDIGTTGFVLRCDSDPDVLGYVVATSAGTVNGVSASSFQVDNNITHHLCLTWDGSNIRLYGDGALVAGPTALAGTIAASTASLAYLGGYTIGPGTVAGAYGTYDEVAIYDTALSAARVLAHYQAISTPWNNDTPGARAGRILDAAAWTGGRGLDTGTGVFQSAALGTSALDYLHKIAESEMGALYVTRDGTVRFEARTALVNQDSLATLTDAVGSNPALQYDEPEITDDLVRNVATISRFEGAAITVTDATSVTQNGPIGYTLDGLLYGTDAQSRSMAELIVSLYKDAQQRINAATVSPRGNPSVLFPIVLGLELADRVTVAQTPQGTGAETSQASVVEGIAHTFGPKLWETTFNFSPVRGGTTGYWQLGVAGHSELGQTTGLYF